ncbi:MAG: xylulokinase, partial [Clostridiales bacterium]|nr:xylulokinase [Clostridiales bacterium]
MAHYIGIDLGTSGVKMLLVTEEGRIQSELTKGYPVSRPRPGWSEQNPEDWWDAVRAGLKELVMSIGGGARVRGISFGGQMHGLVVLDKDDAVIRPCILWNDGRTQKQTDFLNDVVGRETLSAHTANIAFAGFTAPKILWMRENEPHNFARIAKIMLPKDYIAYKLTGVYATDYSDASGTLLLDVKRRCWSTEMCGICGIDERRLPRLFESYEAVGHIRPETADGLGLDRAVKIAAGAGDNAAAAIGTGTVGKNACNVSLGTSGTVFISGERFYADGDNALHSFCHADGRYHLMGCILSAAGCNTWWLE